MSIARPAAAPPSAQKGFQLDAAGLASRVGVATILVGVALLAPTATSNVWDHRIALMAIYGIIGLSVNIITGYAGQISLGHQAFVGIGAFTSAYVVGPHIGLGFAVAVPVAGLMGAFLAFALGLVALRVRGLYFALVTLSFGLMTETTIFNWRSFTGGGAGALAPRPSGFGSDQTYAYLCMVFLALFIYVDWRMSKSKAGRGVVAVRNNEMVAASLGVNVNGYKLLAFAVGGFLAGVAGSLFAHWNGQVQALDYTFPDPALTWVVMAVVGGLGSRAGVVIGSAFFAIFPQILPSTPLNVPGWLHFTGVKTVILNVSLTPLIGAFLLILTVTLYPGGIGQQLLPIRRWLAGGPFREPRRAGPAEEAAVLEAVPEGIPEPPQARLERPPEPKPPPPPEPEPAPPEPEPGPSEPEPVASSESDPEPESEPEPVAAAEPGRSGRLFGFRRRKENG